MKTENPLRPRSLASGDTASLPQKLVHLGLIVALLSGGCGKGAGKSAAGPEGATLVFGRGSDSVRLDPAHETDGESFKVCDNIYDTLVQYDDSTTNIVPGLATRWEHDSDGLTWTFHLRPGVKFHDGTPLNAEAVVFSLARQDSALNHPFYKIGGPYTYWRSGMGMDEIIRDIRAADDSTVVIELKKRNAPFLANLAMNFCSIVSPTAARKWGEDFFKHPVGTGPFRLTEWVKDDHITLERNDDYWGGRPKLARLVWRSIPDNTVRYLELKKGSIQGMDGIAPDQVPPIRENPNLVLMQQPGMNVCYLAPNEDHKPFDNAKVRMALNYAVNRKAIVETLYRGLAVQAVNPMPPVVWGYDSSVTAYAYDPAKAKQLLKEAGFPNGFKTRFYAMTNPRPYVPEPQKVAEAIQSDLKAVGVDAEIVSMEWGTYLDKTQHGEHDLCLMGWTGDNGDPDNFLFTLLDESNTRLPSQNVAFYRSQAFHKLVIAAQEEPDQAKREQLYRKAQVLAHADAAWVPLVHMTSLAAFQKNVHGFHLHPTAKERFYKVWIE